MGAAGPSGPMSSTVSIPARPKPGRKPIQHENKEDKNCKRRAQNRDSQRRFRDKRQIKLADATEELGSVKEHMKDLECNYERRLENERMQRQKLEREVKYLKEQILKVTNDKSHFHSLSLPTETRSHSNLPAQPQNPTPTEEYASREIDFTSAFGKRPSRSASSREDSFMECGFCQGDETACLCISENLGRDPQQYTAAASTARGPGSCAACQADETGEMRRKCIELSQNTTYDTTMTDAPAERPAGLDSARGSFADGFGNKFAPMSSQTMSCSEFIHEYQQQAAGRFRPLNDVFGGRVIQGFQAPEGPIDLDHAEAAAVLSSMSRRNTVTQNE